jgi:hypothetical protein
MIQLVLAFWTSESLTRENRRNKLYAMFSADVSTLGMVSEFFDADSSSTGNQMKHMSVSTKGKGRQLHVH